MSLWERRYNTWWGAWNGLLVGAALALADWRAVVVVALIVLAATAVAGAKVVLGE